MTAATETETAPEVTPTPETTPDRPEWLPEKFKSGTDLANAYKELESKLGRSAVPTKPEVSDNQTENEGEPTTPDPAAAEVQAVADNPAFADFHKEFAEKGELGAESYTKLEAMGVTKDMVDQYIAGAPAREAATVGQIYTAAGGQDSYKEMVAWAASPDSGLSEGEIAAFDKAVLSGDIDSAKLAVEGLRSRFRAAVPTKPAPLRGENGKFTGSTPLYTSMVQVTADMAKPEYKIDPAFRAKVQQRLARSNV